jgi:hypothetical protein
VIHTLRSALAGIAIGCCLGAPARALPPAAGALDATGGARAIVTSGFDPHRDAFSFANELIWQYEQGTPTGGRREGRGRPVFGQRCMHMVRQARQFFYGALFDPSLPRVSEAEYAARIERVFAIDPRRTDAPGGRIAIPGFASLREFSREHEALLKQRAGSRWQSYFQRGNWRMLFPFTQGHQRRTADALFRSIERGHPPIVHVMNFPRIDVNHAMLLYRAAVTTDGIRFHGYDPNRPDVPLELRYEQQRARFVLAPTPYFAGGPVKTYEIYRGWLY